ncbi:MAG: amino acid--tRNA ligase-related protein, partial [Nanoarchaeota archaeon]
MKTMQELRMKEHELTRTFAPAYERVKDPRVLAVARIEGALLKGARDYFADQGFTEMVVPHLTLATGACENVDTMFEIDYFGKKAFLSQTGQLFLESLVPGLGPVYTIGPSFRKEEKDDARHLCEFTLIEFEHPGDFEELLGHIEGTITSMVKEVLQHNGEDLDVLGADRARLDQLTRPFPRIYYQDAINLYDEYDLRNGDDITSWMEQELVRTIAKGQPLFITHYPAKIKFFNMRNNPSNADIVNSADLILP